MLLLDKCQNVCMLVQVLSLYTVDGWLKWVGILSLKWNVVTGCPGGRWHVVAAKQLIKQRILGCRFPCAELSLPLCLILFCCFTKERWEIDINFISTPSLKGIESTVQLSICFIHTVTNPLEEVAQSTAPSCCSAGNSQNTLFSSQRHRVVFTLVTLIVSQRRRHIQS